MPIFSLSFPPPVHWSRGWEFSPIFLTSYMPVGEFLVHFEKICNDSTIPVLCIEELSFKLMKPRPLIWRDVKASFEPPRDLRPLLPG